MTKSELQCVQSYLRQTFGNATITLKPGRTRDGMAEVFIGDEFIGTLHRDEDEGEVSYAFSMAILDVDLPAAPVQPAAPTTTVTVEHKRPRARSARV